MSIYLDTSALVKLYNEEVGTDTVSELVEHSNVIYISELARLETVSTLQRLCRDGLIEQSLLGDLVCYFHNDLKKMDVIPIDKAVVRKAEELILDLGDHIVLRSLDAIHLATYYLVGVKKAIFVTADKRLAAGAEELGAEIFNPAV